STPVERDRQGVVLAGDESHIWDDYLHRNSAYWGLKWDYTNQVNTQHQLKVGADFQRHTLRRYRHVLPVQVVLIDSTMVNDYKELNGNKYPAKIYHSDPTSFLQDADYYGYYWAPVDSTVLEAGHWQYDSTFTDDQLSKVDTTWIGPYYKYSFDEKKLNSGRQAVKHPITASAYIEDKFEYQGVVINAGLRYDYLNVDTKAVKDPERPLGADNTTLDPQDLVNNKVQNVVSPRIGFGFPISERTLFHVNYGKFFQQPNLEDLYVSYDYLAYMIRTNPYFNMFGNPNLKPEKTTAYEVGIDHQIASKAKLDIVAYYKDVRDLVEVTNIPSIPNAFSTYRNRDYGTIKGVDLGFTLERTQNIACNMAYSLSWAMGTGSISNTQYNIAWTGSEIPKMTAPLAFDQRHKLSFDFDYRLGDHEGPVISGKTPFENAGINLLFNVGSGQPYTPTFVYNELTLAAVSVTPSAPINSKYGPWTYRVDLKVNKGIKFGPANVNFYVWVLNVFDRRNAEYSYTSTGSPETCGWLATPEGQKWTADNGQQGYELFRQAELNPNNFSVPRMVRFGIKTDF
ncbi:MAG TPA: TonB-dependent receptor, partial [bacterium]|nr:TonB-dependent receptor [bacterium]